MMGLESFYGEKKKKGFHTCHYCPCEHLSLSLPTLLPDALKAFTASHSFLHPLQPDCHLHTLESASFSDLLAFTISPLFCTCYLKQLMLLNTSFPKDVPESHCCLASEDTILLSFLSVSLLSSLGVSSSSHLFPSPSEDFSKGSANSRFHLFLKLCK